MNIQELKEIIQSSHLNFLIGAGLSTPYLPILGDIETRLTGATKKTERVKIEKEYFEKVMIPNLDIVEDKIDITREPDFKKTRDDYKEFFELIASILLNRKNTILSKQANIFTTNIDILMELALEGNRLEYNDGFSGRLDSVFSLSNFKKSILKRSLHFENISEIPVFNLIKIHGSLTWNKVENEILFSGLKHFKKDLLNRSVRKFEEEYKKLAIINPEKKKLEETVIDIKYYELLRMYSGELEKENSVLFVMGFSMEDEHIREITIRAANSNPTLKVYILCHSKDEDSAMRSKMDIGKLKYANIEIVKPDGEEVDKYNLENINQVIFKQVFKSAVHDDEE